MAATWITLLLLLLALGASVACFVLFRRLRQHERRHQALINVLRNEIQAMTNSSIGMGRRLIEVEQKLNLTADKQLELENRDPSALAYNQATRLMEMGADVDDLVQNCGIGRPEAELMALLHKELHAPHQSLGSDR
ncbi:DUF2802 domain-containing protein [Neptuniibacter halophilus]|uniref:DUF2802 domain-containing protein n=1 Tax=Neptuniibacter halophilus TaxID=651666 RepID=UPI0025734403|nr:DUF2802 domain-containing protein [Neptuniibacter halophilus]